MQTSVSRPISAGTACSKRCDRVADDVYLTIAAPAEAASRERSSKFLSYIYPVASEEEIRGSAALILKCLDELG